MGDSAGTKAVPLRISGLNEGQAIVETEHPRKWPLPGSVTWLGCASAGQRMRHVQPAAVGEGPVSLSSSGLPTPGPWLTPSTSVSVFQLWYPLGALSYSEIKRSGSHQRVRIQTEPDYTQVLKSPGLIRVPGNQAIVLLMILRQCSD